MPRILCIDYGKKRTGIAVTDPLKIIATALTTVETKELFLFLKNYFHNEEVELVLISSQKIGMQAIRTQRLSSLGNGNLFTLLLLL